VLIEAALQPCGWLASYVGCAVNEKDEVFFRNLDGSGVLHRAVRLGRWLPASDEHAEVNWRAPAG
jgi:hypothetical protein